MEAPNHSLSALFDQLGLDSSEAAIEKFIADNKPVPADVPLCAADFWNPSQASFLKTAVDDDADWAEVVDHLDVMLR